MAVIGVLRTLPISSTFHLKLPCMGAVTTVWVVRPSPAILLLRPSSSLIGTEVQVSLSFLTKPVLEFKSKCLDDKYAYLHWKKKYSGKLEGKLFFVFFFYLFRLGILLLYLINMVKHLMPSQPEASAPGFLLRIPSFLCSRGGHLLYK